MKKGLQHLLIGYFIGGVVPFLGIVVFWDSPNISGIFERLVDTDTYQLALLVGLPGALISWVSGRYYQYKGAIVGGIIAGLLVFSFWWFVLFYMGM